MRLVSADAHIFMPRALRKNLFERLRIPWRLPAGVIFTLPVPVRRKRFLTLLFVFISGFCLSQTIYGGMAPDSIRKKCEAVIISEVGSNR